MTERVFQDSDLSRRHREVLDAARRGSAVIRDRDGFAFLLEPAAHASFRTQMIDWLLSAVRIDRALHLPADQRTAWDFGDFGWIADLDVDDQTAFLDGFLTLLVKNVNADSSKEVKNYLADWLTTAQDWSDPETRAALLDDATTPLRDLEL